MAKKAYIGVDGKARKIKKGYIGVENFVPRALPEGYTQVEYIQSSGTQYIDTGFKPNQDSRIDMVAQLTGTVGENNMLFGTRSSGSTEFFVYYHTAGNYYGRYLSASLTVSKTMGSKVFVSLNKNLFTVDETSVSATYSSFQCTTNAVLFAWNNTGTISDKSSMRLYSCQIYDNGTLVRDYVPCISPSGTAGLYDMVNAKFYANAGTGLFATGEAYKGIARKIKKAYIGVGGVARPCWSGGELAYYGTIAPLSTSRYGMMSATVGNYGLFAQGVSSRVVDAYNDSLVQTSLPDQMYAMKEYASGASVGNYAVFFGGGGTNVYAVSSSLSVSELAAGVAAQNNAGATTGKYAVFAGGRWNNHLNAAYSFDASLTRKTITSLSLARSYLSATTVGDYALFGGGYGSGYHGDVDVYNASLTRTTATQLSLARGYLAATSVGDYALFAGGYSGTKSFNEPEAVVDVYDSSLTRTTGTALSTARQYMAATTIGNYAIFAGGLGGDNAVTAVDVYDESLTRTTSYKLNTARQQLAAVSVGNYALFGGGFFEYARDVVEAFTVA